MRSLRFAALLLASATVFAQAPASSPADPLPAANPKFFQAKSPTVDTVNSFLKALWGYDETRLYRVMAIMPTPAAGVSKVVVFITSTAPGSQVQSTEFFTLPDGKHAIAEGNVIPFGAKPFAENRALMQSRADGPARGPASKELLLVEFADMQCPHCKEAQSTMENLHEDFPQARIVFQNFPLTEIHPFAEKAAVYGNCIAEKSNDAFFTYLSDVFEHQESLTPELGDTTLKNAMTKAGQDPAAIAACAATPAAKKKIQDQIAFANEIGVSETPMLSINGHLMPIGGIPYEVLKQMVAFQAREDGVK